MPSVTISFAKMEEPANSWGYYFCSFLASDLTTVSLKTVLELTVFKKYRVFFKCLFRFFTSCAVFCFFF